MTLHFGKNICLRQDSVKLKRNDDMTFHMKQSNSGNKIINKITISFFTGGFNASGGFPG